ncbi:MAG TPA: hypothetical protein DEF47_06155 [Herpetosiphon sp.]|nr:hypothetical protein [Herpetosiphon sp.]HBW49466.1 hypothetical protein [Herpetosiphon sp.]
MKRSQTLLYAAVALGGVVMITERSINLFNSSSLETTLYGFAMLGWSLWVTSHIGYYWLFMRQYRATATEPRPTLALFEAWLNPSQQRVLIIFQASSVGFGVLWLLTKWLL